MAAFQNKNNKQNKNTTITIHIQQHQQRRRRQQIHSVNARTVQKMFILAKW